MKVAVWGFGHFANVLCCVLESWGCQVRQEDLKPHLVRKGQPDGTQEPGYKRSECVGFIDCLPDVIWAAYDVPLDDAGRGLDRPVVDRIESLLDEYSPEPPVVLSCQWRVGTTAQFERLFPDRVFTYVMENVRVGHAIHDFRAQWAPIVGTRALPTVVGSLLAYLGREPLIMTPESAEMTKHALNGFLALNIAYANEIADLCAVVKASPIDVLRAVATDARVSSTAPLRPGAPFGGGSLMRDVLTLEQLAAQLVDRWRKALGPLPAAPIIQSIRLSNKRPEPVQS